ncbi:purine-nucleoside phosphorylase [Alsobacter sp. R-9]
MTASVDDAVAALEPRLGGPVDLAVVLGTGLGGFAEAVTDPLTIPYADIPGWPCGNVTGHAHRLVVGVLEGRRIAVLQGRAHYYETGDAAAMRTPIETLRRLGVSTLVLTNAAGSLKKDILPGHLCLITDHINLSGGNPLIGDRGDGRFVPMNDAYSLRLRNRMKRAAVAAGVRLAEGVYCWMSGPSFETPAEIRMIRTLGADLVGMSTVPETILARRFGIDVVAVSIVTNFGAGLEVSAPSHAETKEVAATGGIALRRLLNAFVKGLDDVS